jgi:two-component system nitrate/nitrite response regulator NarL
LSALGLTVVGEAGTCEEALVRSADLRPDAVVVDIGLPDGDGFTLARKLSTLGWRPRVVLVSTDSDSANRATARETGAVGFVPKDEFLGDELRDLICGR